MHNCDSGIPPVPPASDERLKQRQGVGEAGSFGLHARDRSLQIGLLGGEQDREAHASRCRCRSARASLTAKGDDPARGSLAQLDTRGDDMFATP
jgi:hypothetical protein